MIYPKLGDTFLYFCSAIYFSREAWEHGHWKGVVAIWIIGVLLDALHSTIQSGKDKKTKEFYAGLEKRIEEKSGRVDSVADRKYGPTAGDALLAHNKRIDELKKRIDKQRKDLGDVAL